MQALSVRFYKRLILVVLLLLILIPTVLAVRFGLQNAGLRKQLAAQDGPVQSAGAVPPGEAVDLVGDGIGYQSLYPELYSSAQVPKERKVETDTVYLTFDCVPGENTREILDILDDYGVKATFFIADGTQDGETELLREIVDKGHAIGLESYSNSYQTVYQSVSSYLEDLDKLNTLIYDATGVRAELVRFPGGSVNAYNSAIYQELIAEVLRRGYVFYDWNVSGGDTQVGAPNAQNIVNNVMNGMYDKDWGIVALRDSVGKEAARDALPELINGLKSSGYSLQPLTPDVMPAIFSYKNAP